MTVLVTRAMVQGTVPITVRVMPAPDTVMLVMLGPVTVLVMQGRVTVLVIVMARNMVTGATLQNRRLWQFSHFSTPRAMTTSSILRMV